MGEIRESVKKMVAFQQGQRAAKERKDGSGHRCEKHHGAFLVAHLGVGEGVIYRCPLCYRVHEVEAAR